jgi:HK97 family phage major capsid protein
VDLSAPGIETVIWDDITRAYDTKVEALVLTGTVTNAKGLLQLAGVNSRTYVDATPTVPELYPKLAAAIADVHTNVFESPNVIVMGPLRWAWILASLDTQNRPLVVPVGQPGFNAAALQQHVAAEAIVGQIMGLPVVVSATIPQTLGAGTEDAIIVMRADEVRAWEGQTPRLRVFGEVLSGTLQVRFQLYNYYAIMAGRLPKAITTITGTGLIAPTF